MVLYKKKNYNLNFYFSYLVRYEEISYITFVLKKTREKYNIVLFFLFSW